MSFLKKWASKATEEEKPEENRLAFFPVPKPEADTYGPGRPSPENAGRAVEDRLTEARELIGELIDFYNERASVHEYDAGFPRDEAERLAMLEVQATDTYRRWRALG